MTTRSHLRFLEDSLKALRGRTTADFRLADSMTTVLSDEDVETGVAGVKASAAAAADRKRAGLAE